MRSLLVSIFLLVPLGGFADAQADTNDAWERALPVDDWVPGWSTTGATQDGSSPCDVGSSPDVWFVHTPAEQNTLTFSTASEVGFDTVLSLYTLDGKGELVVLACDDDGGAPQAYDSAVVWAVEAARPYFIRVTGKNGATGRFVVSINRHLPESQNQVKAIRPVTGDPSTPLPISPGLHQGYTRNEPGPVGECLMFLEDAWFSYRPALSGTATLAICYPVPTLTVAWAYVEQDGLPHAGCLSCSGGHGTQAFPVQGGSIYRIRLGTIGDGTGVYGLQLDGPPAVGESCATAEPIGEGYRLLSLVGHAPSGGSACSSALDPAHYFRYVAPASGTLSVSTCTTTAAAIGGYAVDAALSLHSACPADQTTELDCNKLSVLCLEGFRPQPWLSTTVTQGQEILIRVSARAEGQLGPIELHVQLEPHLAACFGDGSGTPCPCGNAGGPQRGCDNSLATGGAKLEASGTAALFGGTLTLVSSGAPASAPVLLLQALDTRNNGQGAPFADGLLCVEGDMRRLVGAIGAQGSAVFGEQAGQSLSQLGGVLSPGTRWYQGVYRNVGGFCTASPANLTNAVRVTWTLFP